ncbi:putative manganese-dependent inorganic diphosphatase [Methanorbis furvi]|uniref:inorganic diphosphatase n=1 Tax=Methanorbis furvi TaxID=3028299 RepID=A0AAE4MCW2_9EURY|nr:Cobalt-dependent inorganic pyrophosphatase [Methanocorpusculaceae archaeon Ag1]
MKTIYVIGHRHPDTDSICSVIGYAAYLNKLGGGQYIAARCGDLNAESRFALEKFGVEAPELILNVEPSVADIPVTYSQSATASTPTIDVIETMDANDLRNLPITDAAGKLIGLVSEHGLAHAYVSTIKRENLVMSPMPVETLARILAADIRVRKHDVLEGSVYISIDALHVILSRITEKDIAIVGDDEPTQLALVSAGIAALIIADSAPVGDRLLTAAEARGVTVLSTDVDAFGVAKTIHLTLPAEMIMATDVPTVHMGDTLEYVKELVSNSKYRTACVLDESGKLISTISRNSLMDDVEKSVILLDHNEYSQAVEGIETADIIEIIDHHRLGAMATLQPIRFDLEPVGSTSTIVTRRFMESGIEPGKEVAGALLSGILSDTLGLKMSTSTRLDEEAVSFLAKIADVDPTAYAQELIAEGMSLSGVSQSELLDRDTKEYSLSGKRVIVAQILTPSYEYAQNQSEEIYAALQAKMRESNAPDIYIALYTSVSEMGSDMFAVADESTMMKMHWEKKPMHLEGVVSRKKDFVPRFGRTLANLL